MEAAKFLDVGRLIKKHEMDEAEFALLLSDVWQGKGLGTELLKSLVLIGRKEHLHRIVGYIAVENSTMKSVSGKIGFDVRRLPKQGKWEAEIKLP